MTDEIHEFNKSIDCLVDQALLNVKRAAETLIHEVRVAHLGYAAKVFAWIDEARERLPPEMRLINHIQNADRWRSKLLPNDPHDILKLKYEKIPGEEPIFFHMSVLSYFGDFASWTEDPVKIAGYHEIRSACYFANKRFDEALEDIEIAIGYYPDNPDFHHHKGYVLTELKRYEEAIASFDEAVRLEPTRTDAYNMKASALNKLKRYPEAKKTLLHVIDLSLADEGTWYVLGKNAFYSLGSRDGLDQAVFCYRKAIDIISKKRIDKRSGENYETAIACEELLRNFKVDVTTNFEKEAIDRGMLTQKQIEEIKAKAVSE
ncbi:tetratricopeptide repeat protein [Candidatus Woesearchaeota archaeon]|nr:tetratricopeptide repeat protein [Candidatus Woesearchaeota archaeon]